MTDPRPFGEELRRLRNERGYSLREFAQISNHSKSLLSAWENGHKIPPIEDVDRLDTLLAGGGVLVAVAIPALQVPPVERVPSEIARHYAHQGPVAAEIRRRAVAAKRLDVLAVRGLGILALNDSLLWSALKTRDRPLRMRVLLLDPDCDAAARRAAEIHESAATFAAGIKLSIARMEEIAASAFVDLDVSLYTALPIWRIIHVDDLMWVSSFGETWEGHEATIYEIPASPRGCLWSGYRRQFDDMHAHARRVI